MPLLKDHLCHSPLEELKLLWQRWKKIRIGHLALRHAISTPKKPIQGTSTPLQTSSSTCPPSTPEASCHQRPSTCPHSSSMCPHSTPAGALPLLPIAARRCHSGERSNLLTDSPSTPMTRRRLPTRRPRRSPSATQYRVTTVCRRRR